MTPQMSLYINSTFISLQCNSSAICFVLSYNKQVITLIAKMERLRGEAVNPQIHLSMEAWLDSIKKVQARRRDEIINSTNRHHNIVAGIQTPRIQEDKGGYFTCKLCTFASAWVMLRALFPCTLN